MSSLTPKRIAGNDFEELKRVVDKRLNEIGAGDRQPGAFPSDTREHKPARSQLTQDKTSGVTNATWPDDRVGRVLSAQLDEAKMRSVAPTGSRCATRFPLFSGALDADSG